MDGPLAGDEARRRRGPRPHPPPAHRPTSALRPRWPRPRRGGGGRSGAYPIGRGGDRRLRRHPPLPRHVGADKGGRRRTTV